MHSTFAKVAPSITSMIRMDHTHAIAVFHRYRSDASRSKKNALARNVCLALDVHAQLEDEIFYPALRAAGIENEVLEKSLPEHQEMRSLISRLRQLDPDDRAFDETFHQLMRVVIHHVADEEAVLLPQAERLLGTQLNELGMQMTNRRVQLLAPHAAEAAVTSAQTFPLLSLMFGSLAVLLTVLLVAPARSASRGLR